MHSKINTHKALVSVVIPTYNRVNFLKKSVMSVLNQSYNNLELIIVDDCSTDETRQFITSIQDKRVKYIRHERNKGVHESRNDGIKNASGEYIAFLDDDDEWLPLKLEKQIRCFLKSDKNLGLVYTGFYHAINGSIISKILPQKKGDVREILLKHNIVFTSTVLIRSECFKKVGFFEFMPFVEDWDMWTRISQYYLFDFIAEPLCIYNIHKNQVSGNVRKMIIGKEIMLKKYFDLWKKYPNNLANYLNSMGRLFYYTDYKLQCKRYFIQSLRVKFLQKSLFIDLVLGKILLKRFKKIFTPLNSSYNIIKIILRYLISKKI